MIELDAPVRHALDRLAPPELQRDDWEDVLTRATDDRVSIPPPPWRGRRAVSRSPRRVHAALALVLAAVVAAAIALSVTAPWKGGPSVIAKASAAISALSPSQVIYEKATIGPLIKLCANGGRPGVQCPKPQLSSIELWVEGGTGTRSFRAITHQPLPRSLAGWIALPADPFFSALVRGSGTLVIQLGGLLGPLHVQEAFVYQRYSNTLIRYTQAPTAISSDSFDPVALVRRALTTGQARAAGRANLDGRPVEVIQVQLRDGNGQKGSATYYADPGTYAPVEIVYHHANFLQFPYTPVFERDAPFSIAVRFWTFQRLSATPATRALTNIRAQHKTAKIVCAQEFGLPDC